MGQVDRFVVGPYGSGSVHRSRSSILGAQLLSSTSSPSNVRKSPTSSHVQNPYLEAYVTTIFSVYVGETGCSNSLNEGNRSHIRHRSGASVVDCFVEAPWSLCRSPDESASCTRVAFKISGFEASSFKASTNRDEL
ncbi:hypothetical protein BDN67DRAFT_962518, partial [Paxillus ammoniavirescens]